MGEGGVETDAPIIVASLGEMAAPIITSEGVEAVAPIVAISVLHALSLLFVAIVVPKADTPRTWRRRRRGSVSSDRERLPGSRIMKDIFKKLRDVDRERDSSQGDDGRTCSIGLPIYPVCV